MGKRSDFEKRDKDKYLTPIEGVMPLVPFLPKQRFAFAEPCAGDGRLIKHIRKLTDNKAQCTLAWDIEPEHPGIQQMDAFAMQSKNVHNVDMIITNPPWSRTKASGYLLHRMITHFSDLRPTWLLFDADWLFTKQATPFLDRCVASVAIGRLKWIEGTNMAGKDNCQWALFRKDAREITPGPLLFGKGAAPHVDVNDWYKPYTQHQIAA